MKKRTSRLETEAHINKEAWKDPNFKKHLISNPKEALKKFGMENIPDSLKIKVIEEHEGEWCIVIKRKPKNYDQLDEKDLKELAAGEACGGCAGDVCQCGVGNLSTAIAKSITGHC